MSQFAKIPPLTAAKSSKFCGLPFVSKLSSILFENFSEEPAGIVTLC